MGRRGIGQQQRIREAVPFGASGTQNVRSVARHFRRRLIVVPIPLSSRVPRRVQRLQRKRGRPFGHRMPHDVHVGRCQRRQRLVVGILRSQRDDDSNVPLTLRLGRRGHPFHHLVLRRQRILRIDRIRRRQHAVPMQVRGPQFPVRQDPDDLEDAQAALETDVPSGHGGTFDRLAVDRGEVRLRGGHGVCRSFVLRWLLACWLADNMCLYYNMMICWSLLCAGLRLVMM
mmetsp:Transcript_11823/g.34114  ORF Transcript_11823/g.34114 Transcript_11823/m.34114 type:complete len:229 (+) Transcript_11823:2295-2981(+)